MSADPDKGRSWVPRADAFVNSSGVFIIKVELAAMRRENLELSVEGNRLLVSGHRPDADHEDSSTRYFFDEIPFGAFAVVIDIPPGFDLQLAKAAYQNGFLRVDVPPKEPLDHPRIGIR